MRLADRLTIGQCGVREYAQVSHTQPKYGIVCIQFAVQFMAVTTLPLQVQTVAKSKSQAKQQSRNGALVLILLIFALPIVAGLFFEDYRGVPYGWFIAVVWFVVAIFSLAFGIIYYAQFVLPHHEGENWLKGIAMMLRAALLFGPSASVQQGSGIARKKIVIDPNSPSPSFRTLGAGMVPSHQSIVVGRDDNTNLRAMGPGFVQLKFGEVPFQPIDLRLHKRKATAIANTRDGIPIETSVGVTFQVKQSESDHPDDHLEYPYSSSAVLWASQLNTFDQDNKPRPWSEQLAPQATSYMISEIAQFTLDELWQDPAILNGIQQRVRRQLRTAFDQYGIKVHGVKVEPKKLPDEIIAQRLENWRAPWQSQIRARAALGDAEALKIVKFAKARAQVEIIEKIMQSIDEIRQGEQADLPQIVTLRIIDALPKDSSQTYLSSQVLASLAMESSTQLQVSQPPSVPEDNNSVG
jgi:hypothetical protein